MPRFRSKRRFSKRPRTRGRRSFKKSFKRRGRGTSRPMRIGFRM